jgi:hypothetical protein
MERRMPLVEGSDHLHWRRHDGAASVLLALMIGSLSAAWGQQSRAAAEEAMEPFQAGYTWSWKGAPVAYSRLDFTHQQDDLWVYTSSSEPRGIGHLYPIRPKLESTMRLTGKYVEPLHLKVTGSGTRHDADVQFDWSKGRATGMYEGQTIDLAVTPGVQDDLSVQIAMIRQLVLGQTPEILREIDKNGIRDYLYKRVGAETIDTAIGRIDTIVYSTEHPGSPRITRYWCAPSRGFIPMKVQQTMRGHVEWTMDIDSLKRG